MIVTLDTDFANIIAYPPADYLDMVVMRPARHSKTAVLRVLEQVVMPKLSVETLAGKLWVADDSHVRVHG